MSTKLPVGEIQFEFTDTGQTDLTRLIVFKVYKI
jgi:hypothetical protein